ncbi:MAG: coiled-coil domain-containing protein [Candidatus Geothermarchaeales archaeon]
MRLVLGISLASVLGISLAALMVGLYLQYETFQDMNSTMKSLEGQITELNSKLALLRDELDSNIDSLKEQISEVNARAESLEEQIAELTGKVEALEQEVERLRPLNIQVEYSDLSRPRVFVLMLDGRVIADVLLDPGEPPLAPAVMDLGTVTLARWEFHTIRVTLDDEVVLERRFFLEGEGYLWVGVGDASASFGLEYEPPVWA